MMRITHKQKPPNPFLPETAVLLASNPPLYKNHANLKTWEEYKIKKNLSNENLPGLKGFI